MKIILVRHAQTVDNVKGKMQGYHNDSDFTKEGLRQIKFLVQKLKDKNVSAVYCSDLGRTKKTAEEIAKEHHLKVIPVKELHEGDIGEWRDLPTKEALKKWAEYYEIEKKKGITREEIRPPKGENSFDHLKRIRKFFDKLIKNHQENETVVIVGHSGTNKVFIGMLEKKDPDEFYKVKQDNACINFLEVDENGNLIKERLNVRGHLD